MQAPSTPTCFDQPELPAFALDTINFGSASSQAYQCAMFDCHSVSVEILALGLACVQEEKTTVSSHR